GRHPHHEGRDQVPRGRPRGGGRGMADAVAVPVRRVQPAERPVVAAAHPARRSLQWPRLRGGGLMSVWEYAPAPESRDLANLQPAYRPFIDGAFVDGGGDPLTSINPATEEPLAEVGTASASDVDIAVRAARTAFDTVWGPMPGAERAKYLFRIARLIQERSRELAVLETLDNGKPIKESRDPDVPTAAAHFFYHAGWADKLDYAGYGPDPKPLGVAGQIIPWNFPLLMLAWKIAPALATGNTVVLKPAE